LSRRFRNHAKGGILDYSTREGCKFENLEPKEYGSAIRDLQSKAEMFEWWRKTQNGTLVKLEQKISSVDDKVDSLKDLFLEKFTDLQRTVYERNERTQEKASEQAEEVSREVKESENKRSSMWKQVVTWGIALLIGIPSCVWSFVQLVSFLAKK
jgi:hypothetical protein